KFKTKPLAKMNRSPQKEHRAVTISKSPNSRKTNLNTEKNRRSKENAKPHSHYLVAIGPNNTLLSDLNFNKLDWSCYKVSTALLCEMIFGKKVLETHTLRGRPGPYEVSKNLEGKPRLAPEKLDDIVSLITDKFPVDRKKVELEVIRACRNAASALRRKLR
ncbi:hypothetical protein KR018_001506, partial [Drosophila ironensis]